MSSLEEYKASLKSMSVDQLKAVIEEAQTKRKFAPTRPTRAVSKVKKPKRITEEEVTDGEVGEVCVV